MLGNSSNRKREAACIYFGVGSGVRFVPKSSNTLWLGRRLRESESIARSFLAKSAYGHPFTSVLIEALKTTPILRKIRGFEKVSDIPYKSTFSRAFGEFANSGLGERVHEALVERSLKTELGRPHI